MDANADSTGRQTGTKRATINAASKRDTAGAVHLRRDAPRQGPPFHRRLILHVLDLLLQCILVHGGEYTGIHGYSRTPLVAAVGEIARAPLRENQ